MEIIFETVKKAAVFTLIAAFFMNLFAGTEYRKYFRFAAGLIVTALVAAPVLDIFSGEMRFQDMLERAVFEQKDRQMEDEIRVMGQQYEETLAQQYVSFIREDAADICGVSFQQCEVECENTKIKRITVKMKSPPDNVRPLIQQMAVRYGLDEGQIWIMEE